MKRIIYTCDRCGKEIDADRYHITICKEVPAGEPELIGNSADRDYCRGCMEDAVSFLVTGFLDCKTEEIAPEEAITEHVPPDPEDVEEPEESVLCELKEMEEKPKGRLTPEQNSQILDAYRHGKKYKQIAEIVGTDINKVRSAIHYAITKGII